ncbi:MAG TPA: TfoX/Sxy family protein [Gemmatimonadales bacterium]|nr:TfoX/Sxy family protein [Gemmatimonadales bacterium]
MAFDVALGERVRRALAGTPGLTEQQMFGGLCFLVHGHMCAGIVGGTLMVRTGPEGHAEALAHPHVRPMDFTGRPMTGMVFVDPPALATEAELGAWVARGARFAATLPPKPAKE